MFNYNQSQFMERDARSYNQAGGRQAKAIVNTIRQPNASRFFKGYAQKMVKNQEQNKDYYKSLYGGESFAMMQENDKSKGNIATTVKKGGKALRP